jgi:nucleotide-binding universal stress UspA family protein
MTLSTIVVHLDHTERCETRTLLAARLARVHGSHLRGIAPTNVRKDMGKAPSHAAEQAIEAMVSSSLLLRRRAETVAHIFHSRVSRLGPQSFDVRLVDGDPVDAVVAQGHAGDLLVVGQNDRSAAVENSARRLPEEVMLHAGRSVLILPCTGRFDVVGNKVLVAWDGSREAVLSAHGALPILRRAAQVTLVSVTHGRQARAACCSPQTRNWLRRHGVEVAVEQHESSTGFADSLLECAATSGADLIVMGGYGNSRTREQLLGGATRDVLARACVPVLMAH